MTIVMPPGSCPTIAVFQWREHFQPHIPSLYWSCRDNCVQATSEGDFVEDRRSPQGWGRGAARQRERGRPGSTGTPISSLGLSMIVELLP